MENIAWILTISCLSIAFIAAFLECQRTKFLPFWWYKLCQELDHRWIFWRKGVILEQEEDQTYQGSFRVSVEHYDENIQSYFLSYNCKLSLPLKLKNFFRPFNLEVGTKVLVAGKNHLNPTKIIKIVKFK